MLTQKVHSRVLKLIGCLEILNVTYYLLINLLIININLLSLFS